jgi:hypothetical protein
LKKWIPVKQKLVALKKNAEPYVQKVSTRSVEFYESSRDAVTPHAVKVKVFVHSYYQVIAAFSVSRIYTVPFTTWKAAMC